MRYVSLCFLLFALACKAPENAAKNSPNEAINDPISDPIDEPSGPDDEPIQDDTCENLDHSCRDPVYATIATYDECLMMKDWELDSGIIFWFQINEKSIPGYIRIEDDGVVSKDGYPENDFDNIGYLPKDSWLVSEDCEFYMIDAVTPVVEIKWKKQTIFTR